MTEPADSRPGPGTLNVEHAGSDLVTGHCGTCGQLISYHIEPGTETHPSPLITYRTPGRIVSTDHTCTTEGNPRMSTPPVGAA